MFRRNFIETCIATLFAGEGSAASDAESITKRWIGGRIGCWSDPMCWEPFGVPTKRDNAEIIAKRGDTICVSFNASTQLVSRVTIGGEGCVRFISAFAHQTVLELVDCDEESGTITYRTVE